ncbi:MAG: hypothetical protein LC104_10085 [Bacteroidales bacterium]|nr:hypothetical protein [Bacteroidales bacterium]
MPGSSVYYTVRYLRLKDDVDVNWMRLGMSLRDMLSGSVVEHGELRYPDGSPAEPGSLGSAAISSQEQALDVARAALENPSSVVRQRGFSEQTSIYFWRDGHAAELLSGPAPSE